MTPENKASDLIIKYYYALPNNGSHNGINSTIRRMNEAIHCALIAVDEILYVLNEIDDTYSYNASIFYNEVKQEIETYENNNGMSQ